jgi:hypothetical protein
MELLITDQKYLMCEIACMHGTKKGKKTAFVLLLCMIESMHIWADGPFH